MTAAPEPESGQGLGSVLVVGSGLIGSSIGLALRAAGVSVYLLDQDPTALRLAVDLGAGAPGPPPQEPAVVLVAVPPARAAQVIVDVQRIYPKATLSDVSSIKSHLEVELETLEADLDRFVGGHPMAGRERSGAGAARADLFEGRPWVLTPTGHTSPGAIRRVEALVRACRAVPVVMTADRHDRAVALVSHAPQLVASLTAARLADADDDLLALAGQGVRDLTRIAESDPALWVEIIAANAGPVLAVLDALSADLEAVRGELAALAGRGGSPDPYTYEQSDSPTDLSTNPSTDKEPHRGLPVVRDVLERGNEGRRHLPGKHGAAPATFATVPVVVEDRPGELARLLVASGHAGVNVEDVRIEHSPGQPVGLVELAVRPELAATLAEALTRAGWSVHL